jgi:uncharacterized protein involved in exopolysaccharide biosynthesis
MNTPANPPPKRAERLYRLLLKAYPAEFRREFEEKLVQLFLDQHRDATGGGSRSAPLGFWVRTLKDTTRSASREHLDQLRTTLTGASPGTLLLHSFRTPWRGFSVTFAAGVVITLVQLGTVQPAYMSTARAVINGRNDSLAAFDPHQRQVVVDALASDGNMGEVARALNLSVRWGNSAGERPLVDSIHRLHRGLEIRGYRNTALVEVSYFGGNAVENAEIANQILTSYIVTRGEALAQGRTDSAEISIIDQALPGRLLVRGHRGVMTVRGLVLSGLTGLLAAAGIAVLRLFFPSTWVEHGTPRLS